MSKSGISLTQPPSSSPASTLSFKSAWAKGPPRSLATSSPLSPLSPPTSASTDVVSSPNDSPALSLHTPEPPPRPKRNPARKESFGGADEKTPKKPLIRQSSSTLVLGFMLHSISNTTLDQLLARVISPVLAILSYLLVQPLLLRLWG